MKVKIEEQGLRGGSWVVLSVCDTDLYQVTERTYRMEEGEKVLERITMIPIKPNLWARIKYVFKKTK